MKEHITRKYIRAVYAPELVQVGYCAAQHLLRYCEPFAYNSGVYGWNCDYYYENGICISTGYNPHGVNMNDITRKFEGIARFICEDYNTPYEVKKQRLAEVREEWLNEIKNTLKGGK